MRPIQLCIWCYLYAVPAPTEGEHQSRCLYSAGWSCDPWLANGMLGSDNFPPPSGQSDACENITFPERYSYGRQSTIQTAIDSTCKKFSATPFERTKIGTYDYLLKQVSNEDLCHWDLKTCVRKWRYWPKRSAARRHHYVRAQKVRFGLALAFFWASLTILYILYVHLHSM